MTISSQEVPRVSKSLQIRSWLQSMLPVKSESSLCINDICLVWKSHLYSQDTSAGTTFIRLPTYSNISAHNLNHAQERSFKLWGLRHAHLYTWLNLSVNNIKLLVYQDFLHKPNNCHLPFTVWELSFPRNTSCDFGN